MNPNPKLFHALFVDLDLAWITFTEQADRWLVLQPEGFERRSVSIRRKQCAVASVSAFRDIVCCIYYAHNQQDGRLTSPRIDPPSLSPDHLAAFVDHETRSSLGEVGRAVVAR